MYTAKVASVTTIFLPIARSDSNNPPIDVVGPAAAADDELELAGDDADDAAADELDELLELDELEPELHATSTHNAPTTATIDRFMHPPTNETGERIAGFGKALR